LLLSEKYKSRLENVEKMTSEELEIEAEYCKQFEILSKKIKECRYYEPLIEETQVLKYFENLSKKY